MPAKKAPEVPAAEREPLHVLIQPMYSKQELNADSNYVVYTAFVRGMLKTHPQHHFVVVFPDSKSGFRYDNDGFFDLPNVTRIPQRIAPRKHANANSFDAVYFDDLYRQWGFDLVWCNLVETAAQLKHSGENGFEALGRPVTVAAHNYTIHESLPYPFDEHEHTAFAQIMGATLADWNVFNSTHTQHMFIELAQRWLRGNVISDIMRRSSMLVYGTLEPELVYAPPDNPIPVIAYNHRLQGYKNWRATFDMLASLHEAGYKFKVRYMNNTAENTSHVSRYPFVEVRLCANRAAYLEALRGCDLNITNSAYETFCIAAVESMALGQPLIAPYGVTFPEITGRNEIGYPYLFRSPEEQRAQIIELLTDADKRREWGRKASDFVHANYNASLWTERYGALFQSLVPLAEPTDAARAAFADVPRGVYETRALYRLVSSYVDERGSHPFSSQSLTLTKLVRLARALGHKVRVGHGKQYVSIGAGAG